MKLRAQLPGMLLASKTVIVCHILRAHAAAIMPATPPPRTRQFGSSWLLYLDRRSFEAQSRVGDYYDQAQKEVTVSLAMIRTFPVLRKNHRWSALPAIVTARAETCQPVLPAPVPRSCVIRGRGRRPRLPGYPLDGQHAVRVEHVPPIIVRVRSQRAPSGRSRTLSSGCFSLLRAHLVLSPRTRA